MNPLLHRFVLLQLLMLWQGGFVFYALVVVPIGTDVLGSAIDQGFITRRVMPWMNGLGVACLAVMFFDSCKTDSIASIRRFFTWLAALLLISLSVLYPMLDRYLDPEQHTISENKAFYRLHAGYLIVSGLLWLLMLLNGLLTLIAWRAADARIQITIMDEKVT